MTLFKENEEANTTYEPPALEIDEAGRVLLPSAQDLVAALPALRVAPPSASAAATAVSRQAAWEAKTVQICTGAASWHAWHAAQTAAGAAPMQQPPDVPRVTMHDLAVHIAAADHSRFSCERVEELRGLLEAPSEALATLRRTLTKRGAGQKMDKCIAIVADSAKQARGALQRVLRAATGSAAPAGAAPDVELNCLCQQVCAALRPETSLIDCRVRVLDATRPHLRRTFRASGLRVWSRRVPYRARVCLSQCVHAFTDSRIAHVWLARLYARAVLSRVRCL